MAKRMRVMRRALPAKGRTGRDGSPGVVAPDGGQPCDRCARPTRRTQELFDGRIVPLCRTCWDEGFSDEQRDRIEAAIAARRQSSASEAPPP
jgi:hypothetical protein